LHEQGNRKQHGPRCVVDMYPLLGPVIVVPHFAFPLSRLACEGLALGLLARQLVPFLPRASRGRRRLDQRSIGACPIEHRARAHVPMVNEKPPELPGRVESGDLWLSPQGPAHCAGGRSHNVHPFAVSENHWRQACSDFLNVLVNSCPSQLPPPSRSGAPNDRPRMPRMR
jgi:hypothetical protein